MLFLQQIFQLFLKFLDIVFCNRQPISERFLGLLWFGELFIKILSYIVDILAFIVSLIALWAIIA
jgi:hypothetical protein